MRNNAGILKHICVSPKKGTVKQETNSATLIDDHGIQGDAHGGDWHRQISILTLKDIDMMRGKGLDLEPGAFGENLVIDGIDFDVLAIGTELQIGDASLRITQVGKVCHTRCHIYHTSGDCIMPRAGLFAEVVRGGDLKSGMSVDVTREVARSSFQVAVLTVSDRCARGETIDTSGPALVAKMANEDGFNIAWTGIVPDDEKAISKALVDLAGRKINLILTTGGTGFSARDVTPEVTRKLIEKDAPGIAELMRFESAKVTPHAWLQRGIAGIFRQSLIINLPGSKKASTENLSAIQGILPHALRHLRDESLHAENDMKRMINQKA